MLRLAAFAASVAVCACVFAADAAIGAARRVATCEICHGRGKLVLTPPDYGQHKGAIEHKSKWDVKIKCTVCDGRGKVARWRRDIPKPAGDDAPPPCSSCGWDGIVTCRKCTGTGVVACRHRNCKDGWIVTEQAQNSKYKKPPVVTPCPECHGLGKVVCAECRGTGGLTCPRCHGVGRAEERRK